MALEIPKTGVSVQTPPSPTTSGGKLKLDKGVNIVLSPWPCRREKQIHPQKSDVHSPQLHREADTVYHRSSTLWSPKKGPGAMLPKNPCATLWAPELGNETTSNQGFSGIHGIAQDTN